MSFKVLGILRRSSGHKTESPKPETCSLTAEPLHKSIDRYGGLMLGLVASVIILEMTDRLIDVLKLSYLCGE